MGMAIQASNGWPGTSTWDDEDRCWNCGASQHIRTSTTSAPSFISNLNAWEFNASLWRSPSEDEDRDRRDREATKAALGRIRDLAQRALTPAILVFRRFDFRSAPRWRAQRWRART